MPRVGPRPFRVRARHLKDENPARATDPGVLSRCPRKRIIDSMNWKQKIAHWRNLQAQEQARIRLARLPRKVARSMAFEGEPVDERMLEKELDRLTRQRVT